MTAKEIVHQLQDDGTMTDEKAIALINQYALHIAKQAGREVCDIEHYSQYTEGLIHGAKATVSRIKTLIEE